MMNLWNYRERGFTLNVRRYVLMLVLTCVVSPTVTYGGNGPVNLRATLSGGVVTLRWDAPLVDASSVTSHLLIWDGRSDDLATVRSRSLILPGRRRHWPVSESLAANERYRRFRLRARRGRVESAWSNTVVFDMETNRTVSLPSSPANVVGTVYRRTVSLSWDDAMDATIVRYEVRHRTGDVPADGDWGGARWREIAGTTDHVETGLTYGTAYTFEVRAVNAAGRSPAASVSATPVPAAPGHLKAMSGDGRVRLKWDDPMDAGVTGFQVRYSLTGAPPLAWLRISAGTSVLVGGLRNGYEYTFEVRATAGTAHGPSSEVRATPRPPPAAPEDLAAWPGDGRVVLTWSDGGEMGITGYEISYSDAGGMIQDWTASSVSDGLSTTVTGLTNGTRYTMGLRAVNGAGEGAASHASVLAGALVAPEGLGASAGEGMVTLSWDRADDRGIGWYEVRYTDAGGMVEEWTAIPGRDAARHTVGSLANGRLYTFEVRGANPAGEGASSAVTAAAGAPVAPRALRWLLAQGSVGLTWAAAGNAAITGYEVRWYDGSSPDVAWTDIVGSDAATTSYTVTGVMNVRSYTFEVRAVSAAGPGASAGVMPMTPKAPEGLRAEAGVNAVTLVWDAPPDASITTYQVRVYRAGAEAPAWSDVPESGAGTVEHTERGLTNGTAYTFDVRAVNTFGAGAASSASAVPVPAPPAGLEATAGVGQVTLRWADPMDTAVTGYQFRSSRAGMPYTAWINVGVATSHAIGGLTNGNEYTFEVRATAGAVHGDASLAKATPYPAAPAGLETTAGVNQVRLDWHESGDASVTAYQLIYYSGGRPAQPAWNDIPGNGAGTPDHRVTGLTNGTTYTFEVRAKATATPGDSSVATDTPVPGAPAGLTGLSRDGSVVLSWEESGDAAIDRYQVRHAESGAALPGWRERHYVAGAGTTDHRVTELTNGTTYTFEVRARAGAVHGAAAEVTAMPLSCPALAVDGLNDTTVTLGQALSMTAAVSGVQGNRYSLTVDPAQGSSLTIDEQSGAVTGTATAVGTYAVTVTATDDRACTWSHTFTVQVCPVITVAAIEDVSVTAGGNVSRTARATGGCGAITYAMTGAPEGVRIETVTENRQSVGRISGAPGGPAREYEVTVTATDAEENTGDETFTITVQCGEITLTTPGTVGVTVGSTRAFTARAAGGQPGYTFTKTSGPSWVTVTEGGNVSAREAPAPQRTYPVGVSIEDVHGCTGTGSFTVAVCTQMVFEAINAVTVTAGSSVSRRAVANGGCGEKTYEKSDGPGWVTVENDGSITVAPPTGTATGTYIAKVRATGDYGITAEKSFRIEVRDPRPTCSPITVSINPSPVKVVAGQSATATASARGGCPPITFGKKANSDTPTWVTVAENGAITINPPETATGNYTAVVTARDNQNNTAPDKGLPIEVCEAVAIADIPGRTVTVGDEISITPSARGGCGDIKFSIRGALPPGVTFDGGAGVIIGTVGGSADTYDVTVKATDKGLAENAAETGFTLTVICPTITVDAGDDMTVAANGDISRTVTATGGGTSHTFSLSIDPSSGLDLSIGETNGSITGSASKAGAYTVTVTAKATNAPNCPAGSDDFIVTVDCPDISVGGLSDVTVMKGSEIPSMTATATGGQSPYTFRRESGPSWVTVSSSGAIGGTATGDPGEYDVTVEATDDCGCTGTRKFKITVECPTIKVGGLSDVTVTKGGDIPAPLPTASVTGGQPPHTYTISGAPGTVGINATTGVISGNVGNTVREFDVTVTATDACGCTGEGSLTINVTEPLVIGPIADVDALVDLAISPITPTASGGRPPYTFTMSGAPSSLSIVASTGRITGTPRQANRYDMTVTVRDKNRKSATTPTFQLRVTLPLRLASISNVVASRHEAISAIQVSATGGKPPYDYSLTASPSSGAGLSISSSGSITGAPAAVGSFAMRVTVTDDDDNTKSRSFTMLVAEPIIIGPIADMYGEIHASFSEGPVEVSGGVTPYRYSLSGQPSGLGVSNTGVISGTPTASGDFDVTLTVTGEHGRTESSLFFMTISSGDFNRDGRADAEDSKLFKEKMGLRRSDAEYDRRMDMNGDGIINWADFIILTRHIERDASSRVTVDRDL